MATVVYADVLIFLNTIITFIIILTTADLIKIESEKIRYLTGSLVGGVFSLIILAPEMNIFLTLISRMLICILIVIISFNVKSFRKIIKCISGFIIITFLYSAFFYFVFTFTHYRKLYYNNGYFYFDFSALTAIFITAIIFLILWLIKKLIVGKADENNLYNVEIFVDNKIIKVNALYDTGNSIKDNFTGQPVILLSLSDINILDDNLINSVSSLLNNENFILSDIRLRLLPVKTLGEYKLLPAFSSDKAIIINDLTKIIVEKPTIAVCEDVFSGKAYSSLINSDVLGRGNQVEF